MIDHIRRCNFRELYISLSYYSIYKYILQDEMSKEKIEYYFINSLGIGKTLASVKILEELNHVKISKEGYYFGVRTGEKTNLELSNTYLELQKGERI